MLLLSHHAWMLSIARIPAPSDHPRFPAQCLCIRMTQLPEIPDLDVRTVTQSLENHPGGGVVRLDQCGHYLDPVGADCSVTGGCQRRAYATTSILGKYREPVNPALAMIVRPQDNAYDPVTLGRHKIQVGELLELPAEGLLALPTAEANAQSACRPDPAYLIIVLRRGPANRYSRPSLCSRLVHTSSGTV